MTTEEMEKLLKAKPGKRELYVILAMRCGYKDTYGIQQVTGFRKEIVEAVAQNMQVISKDINSNTNNTITLVPAQNMQTPPQRLLQYLNSQLGITTNSPGRDLKAIKSCYLLAYEKLGRNQIDATYLVKDVMDFNLEGLRKAVYPALFFIKVFKAYLRILPVMPNDRREYAKAYKKRLRYNPITKQWETANDRIQPTQK